MEELLELEHAGWASLCDGTGADFYGDVMTADGVMVLANGTVMDRKEVVEALRDSPSWAAYELDVVRSVQLSEDSTALVYTGIGHRDGAGSFVGVMTSTYVRRSGEWKLAVYQQTPKPEH